MFRILMIGRLRTTFLFFLVTILIGCVSSSNKDTTYLGGKIINPKSRQVVLYFNEKVVDTFLLDDNNSFLSKIDVPNEGLFYFKHGPEHQYIYLEPNDSILFRLNTWRFDETLVFSGKGADRNNMLIDCFIDSEKDRRKFYKLYKLNAKDFKSKVSQIEKSKMHRYEQFLKRNQNETDQFKSLLKMALTYPLYSKIEDYPLAKREQSKIVNLTELDSTFYSHRSKIDMNKDSIMFYFAYRDFVISHLYNRAFTEGNDITTDGFTISLLNKVNKNINNDKTKNALLRQITIGHFYRKSSCNVNMDAFDTFFKLSTNEYDKRLVNKLLDDVNTIPKGKKIASFNIRDYNNKTHDIKSVIKGKNSVVYFWNPKYMSKEYVASKVNLLTKKYPNVKFVGVKIKDGKFDRIHKLDIKSQFYLSSTSEANKFLSSEMPRTLLINKKGYVVNGYASLSSQNIYNQIEDLAKY